MNKAELVLHALFGKGLDVKHILWIVAGLCLIGWVADSLFELFSFLFGLSDASFCQATFRALVSCSLLGTGVYFLSRKTTALLKKASDWFDMASVPVGAGNAAEGLVFFVGTLNEFTRGQMAAMIERARTDDRLTSSTDVSLWNFKACKALGLVSGTQLRPVFDAVQANRARLRHVVLLGSAGDDRASFKDAQNAAELLRTVCAHISTTGITFTTIEQMPVPQGLHSPDFSKGVNFFSTEEVMDAVQLSMAYLKDRLSSAGRENPRVRVDISGGMTVNSAAAATFVAYMPDADGFQVTTGRQLEKNDDYVSMDVTLNKISLKY